MTMQNPDLEVEVDLTTRFGEDADLSEEEREKGALDMLQSVRQNMYELGWDYIRCRQHTEIPGRYFLHFDSAYPQDDED